MTKESTKYKLGSLIIISKDRKFPVVLRGGPGYTFSRVETIEPGEIAIVLGTMIGHGMIWWILIHVAVKEKTGWIPEGLIYHAINHE